MQGRAQVYAIDAIVSVTCPVRQLSQNASEGSVPYSQHSESETCDQYHRIKAKDDLQSFRITPIRNM